MNYSYYYDSPDGPVTEKQRKAILTEMRRMVKDGVNLVRRNFP